MASISKSNTKPSQWPSNWLFSSEKILLNDLKLEQRQQHGKFIVDLCMKLNSCLERKITYQCIFTAILYAQRFFMVHSYKNFYPLRLCQAAIFLACKREDSLITTEQICVKTAELSPNKWNLSSKTKAIVRNAILKYEDLLFSTLGLGYLVQHPFEILKSLINKIRAKISPVPLTLLNQLKDIAYYLAKQSILLTTFSLQYPNDLIAYSCVQFAIRIQNNEYEPTIQLPKSINIQQIEQLIREFSKIFYEYAPLYNELFQNKNEYDLYIKILEITKTCSKPPSSPYVSLALHSKTISHSTHDIDQNTHKFSSEAVPSIPSLLTSTSLADKPVTSKHPRDSSNDDDMPPSKRFSSIFNNEKAK